MRFCKRMESTMSEQVSNVEMADQLVDILRKGLGPLAELANSYHSRMVVRDIATIIERDMADEFMLLFESGELGDINEPHPELKCTFLSKAASCGSTKLVKKLLAIPGIDVVQRKTDLMSCSNPLQRDCVSDDNAVYQAVINGHVDVARLLANAGARIHVVDAAGEAPLFWDIPINTRNEMVRFLLESGEDPNGIDEADYTVLMDAAIESRRQPMEDCMRMLLEAGADASVNTDKGTFLMCCVGYCPDTKIPKSVLRGRTDLNVDAKLKRDGTTALMKAVECKKEGWVRFLIELGADPFIEDEWNRIAYDFTDQCASLEMKKRLEGALESFYEDRYQRDGVGERLHLEVEGEIVFLYKDVYKQALEFVIEGQLSHLRALVDNGIIKNINYSQFWGGTLLWAAVEIEQEEIVRYLLTVPGIDVNTYKKKAAMRRLGNMFVFGSKKLPFMAAVLKNNVNIAKLLVKAGANTRLCLRRGETPLMLAAKQDNSLEMIQYLLRLNWNILATDATGKTALDYAKNATVENAAVIAFLTEAEKNGMHNSMWGAIW